MKLDNFYVISYGYGDSKMPDAVVCYYEPGADVNSPGFKEEFDIPEEFPVTEIPMESWSNENICDIMDITNRTT